MTKYRLTILLLLPAMLLMLLTGCRGAEEEQGGLPQQYSIGEEAVAAFLPEGENITAVEEDLTVYDYDGLSDAGSAVAAYTTQMTSKDSGFLVVDQDFVQIDAPDFDVEEGTVHLAKNAAEKGTVISVRLDWKKERCVVAIKLQEGNVQAVEEAAHSEGMTLIEAVDYFYTLSPSDLGLSGTSMREYQVYALDGTSFVDGKACIRVNVYSKDNHAQTNRILGEYLMTANGRNIYRLFSGSVSAVGQF